MSDSNQSDETNNDDNHIVRIPDSVHTDSEEKWLNSRGAARSLGISYPTLKRWIYQKKIQSIKDKYGHHKISLSEINRVRNRTGSTLAREILKLLGKRVVAYTNQIQMNLESQFSHSETNKELKNLVKTGKVKSFQRRFIHYNYVWYHLASTSGADVLRAIDETEDLLKEYHKFTLDRRYESNDICYNDYSEFLVEQAFIASGFKVLAREINYFNGKAVALGGQRGRSKTLDFIIMKPLSSVFFGVQVKNKFESPNKDDFDQLNYLCKGLELRPMMVCRVCERRFFVPMKKTGGRIIVFKRQFLKPGFDRQYFDKINAFGFPIGIYKRPPEFLINMFKRNYFFFK
ncbi:MAG: hypothetical protein M1113_00270 [Candidatus Thermoplasmatota archaeon]|nr:hypothetical protein [Candidatus Thermoplasmatota archaeon]